jgi:hypothetical protein
MPLLEIFIGIVIDARVRNMKGRIKKKRTNSYIESKTLSH